MDIKIKGFADGLPLPGGQGTRVIVAGKPMLLPNKSVPIVVQKLVIIVNDKTIISQNVWKFAKLFLHLQPRGC